MDQSTATHVLPNFRPTSSHTEDDPTPSVIHHHQPWSRQLCEPLPGIRAFYPINSQQPRKTCPTCQVRDSRHSSSSGARADVLALLLAEKHETKPRMLKMTKFSETLDLLKSASAWNKFSLTRFGVKFEKTSYTDLSTLINDPRWYDPETEKDTAGFVDRF